MQALDRFDKIRYHYKGATSNAGEVRTNMQNIMQKKCAVFRTEEFN